VTAASTAASPEVASREAGTVWMARTAVTVYGRSILRTGSRVRLRQVLARGEAA
jgi:hypothetical protein